METRREHNAHCVRNEADSKRVCDGTAEFLVLLRLSMEISIISAYSREKREKNFAVGNFGYYVCDATVNINKPCSDEGYL